MAFPIGVLISGRGSNMAALIRRSQESGIYAVRVVISDQPDAPGLHIAQTAGIETIVIERKSKEQTSAEFNGKVAQALNTRGVQLVVLAGFMRLVTKELLDAFPERVINIHPSLLPKHKGLYPHRQALAANDRESGCSVHLVTEEVDAGPLLGQSVVPIHAGDTEESLAARILLEEHVLLPSVVESFIKSGEHWQPLPEPSA
jgi:phosphoribosylglycinamide formyltransferase 1